MNLRSLSAPNLTDGHVVLLFVNTYLLIKFLFQDLFFYLLLFMADFFL